MGEAASGILINRGRLRCPTLTGALLRIACPDSKGKRDCSAMNGKKSFYRSMLLQFPDE